MTSRSKKSLHAAEQDRDDVRVARANWKREQPRLDPTKLVFIDETGTSTNMTRLRGRCRRGKRLVAKVPHGHCVKRRDLVTPSKSIKSDTCGADRRRAPAPKHSHGLWLVSRPASHQIKSPYREV